MRRMDAKFKDVIELLGEIHEEFSDLRFGQVVQGAIDLGIGKSNVDLHDYTSKRFLQCLEKFREETRGKRRKG